ncbi:MAG: type II secretion system protein [bacterium]
MRRTSRSGGFTLIELLIVTIVIAILAGLVFMAGGAVRRMAKKTQAKVELQSLASALEAYYSDYRTWPPMSVTLVSDPELSKVTVNGDTAKLLQGENIGNKNVKRIAYIQFKSFATEDGTQPVNPWWTSGSASTSHWYYYKVDKDFDNVITAGTVPPPAAGTILRRRVLVWTWNVDSGVIMTSAD